MKTYQKPVISIDEGLAEGVYAESGASEVSVDLLQKTEYYNDSGRADYTVTFSEIALSSITLTFNQELSSASGNTTNTISGKSVTFTYSGWTPASPITLSAIVNSGLGKLQLVSYSYTKQ